MTRHVLAVRLDNAGDVLLMGPAVRVIAAGEGVGRVTMLCGPAGEAAAQLLPGVDDIVVHRAGWIDAAPDPVTHDRISALIQDLAARHIDEAVVFTSFHQSPLPTALILRMADVPRISAISVDYPGSLLDVRHLVDDDIHEVERALSLAEAAGFALPASDDGRLAVRRSSGASVVLPLEPPYVVVHPGASVPARAWSAEHHAALVDALVASGRRVVITGGPAERDLTAAVAGTRRPGVVDAGGGTSLAALAEILAAADVVVTANTGPAHLAAAVGTPVVSIFAPTVPAVRWRPWNVPLVLLGDQEIACAGCRARVCPVEGHPCIERVTVGDVMAAIHRITPRLAHITSRRGQLLQTEVTA